MNIDERHFNYVFQVFAHITWDICKRYLYHSQSALVLILLKRVRLPPQNAPPVSGFQRNLLGVLGWQTDVSVKFQYQGTSCMIQAPFIHFM